VQLTTVHADQGRRQLQAAVAAVSRGVKVLGVTVLTSLTPEDLLAAGIAPEYARDPEKLVLLRARLAQGAGCHGVVCAGTEAAAVKAALGEDFLVVCPGIRPAWAEVPGDDQKRVLTPYQAIKAGADFVVVGRPIRLAPEPVAAARQVVAEIEAGLNDRG
jgi:orotidine-5'-phosphate decarboxylase